MGEFFSGLTPQRVIIFIVCVAFIVLYFRYRWRRAGRYVEDRNRVYADHYRSMEDYAGRVRGDARWPGFLREMQGRYSVVDGGEAPDDDTYTVHYCSIWDGSGKQFEPGEDTAGTTFMSAFLRRKARPRYMRFQLSPTGEVTEERLGGMAWYDLFEKSV